MDGSPDCGKGGCARDRIAMNGKVDGLEAHLQNVH